MFKANRRRRRFLDKDRKRFMNKKMEAFYRLNHLGRLYGQVILVIKNNTFEFHYYNNGEMKIEKMKKDE